MRKRAGIESTANLTGLFVLLSAAFVYAPASAQLIPVMPKNLPRIATVDERYQSYNIEMVEVIGGRFWKPYSKEADAAPKAPSSAQASSSNPTGMDAGLFQSRAPIDLSNPRLRKLAAALGPAYVRVSGTWANTTYFQDSNDPVPATPPSGFRGVLTRPQWKGVVDFSRSVNAKLVTSFAISAGTRDAAGVWTPAQARALLTYTESLGGSIAAAEFMNEPTMAVMGGAPKGYDAAAYARDFAVFHAFIRQAAPYMTILGPGSVGEGMPLGPMPLLRSEDLLAATGPVFDTFSNHFYGALSKRCAGMGAAAQTTAEEALSEEWLSRTDQVEAFYAGLRDKFEPGKALWVTETGETACGGNPWAATFLDSFRYLDQLGRLAQRGVQVIAHNTLAASDYALIDETTLASRPNYWAALLWRSFMGTTVLNPGPSPAPGLHLYAHCQRDHPGGIALLVINTNREAFRELAIPVPSQRYTLTAKELLGTALQLNGIELRVDADGNLPQLVGATEQSGKLVFAPTSITFLVMPGAANPRCR